MSATVRTQQQVSYVSDNRRGPNAGPAISVTRSHGVVIVRPLGGFDRPLADRLRRVLIESTGPVVLDLDDCVLTNPASLELIAADREPSRDVDLVIVCQRLSCRRLLTRAGVGERFSVFERLDDAVQACAVAHEVYGPG